MQIALALYPKFTALDIIGPFQVLADVPGHDVVFVAGHNNSVPEIIAALEGGTFPVIPESEYDNMFVVTMQRFRKTRVLKLKYGNPSPR